MPDVTTTEATQEPTTTAEAAQRSETPEQTIEGLRTALKQANAEAKANRLKAAELDQLKTAQMSDLERATAEREQAARERDEAKAEALRWRIAAANGISDDDAETFLTGSDEATLTRQATRLAEMRATAATSNTPKPDLTQGGSGSTPPALNSDGLEEALKQKLGIA